MQIDLVHDIQKTYRSLVTAFSRPGTIVDVAREAARIDVAAGLDAIELLLALTLVDGEVACAVLPDDGRAGLLRQLTYARRADPEDAAFVFARGEDALTEAVERASVGTLVDPHLGATIIAAVPSLASGTRLDLAGPGIEDRGVLAIRPTASGDPPRWVDLRRGRNREYPLGIDLVLFDESARVVGLPRTTRILEPSWAT